MNIKDLSASAAKQILVLALGLLIHGAVHAEGFPETYDQAREGAFPLAADGTAAGIYIDEADFKVVEIAAGMLADDYAIVMGSSHCEQKIRIYFLDPGIVLQEILVR